MPNDHRLTVRLRLEDTVALVFFLINFSMRVIFRGLERRNVSPADVLVICGRHQTLTRNLAAPAEHPYFLRR